MGFRESYTVWIHQPDLSYRGDFGVLSKSDRALCRHVPSFLTKCVFKSSSFSCGIGVNENLLRVTFICESSPQVFLSSDQ